MKLKLFILTAVLSGILAVSASAEVTNTGATGRDGTAVNAATINANQKDVLTVNAGDIFTFTVNNPGDYITVITYLEGGELGNDTILYVNQYSAKDSQGIGDYTKGAPTTITYKVRSGLANGIYRLEVNSGGETSDKLWYKLGRADLVYGSDGDVTTTYAKSGEFNGKFSAGYKATYSGTSGSQYLKGAGFVIRNKKDDNSLSEESLVSELKLDNFKTAGDITYGMTIYGAENMSAFNGIDVQPYVEYDNTPNAQ